MSFQALIKLFFSKFFTFLKQILIFLKHANYGGTSLYYNIYCWINLMNLNFASDPEFFDPEAQFANNVTISLAFSAFLAH